MLSKELAHTECNTKVLRSTPGEGATLVCMLCHDSSGMTDAEVRHFFSRVTTATVGRATDIWRVSRRPGWPLGRVTDSLPAWRRAAAPVAPVGGKSTFHYIVRVGPPRCNRGSERRCKYVLGRPLSGHRPDTQLVALWLRDRSTEILAQGVLLVASFHGISLLSERDGGNIPHGLGGGVPAPARHTAWQRVDLIIRKSTARKSAQPPRPRPRGFRGESGACGGSATCSRSC